MFFMFSSSINPFVAHYIVFNPLFSQHYPDALPPTPSPDFALGRSFVQLRAAASSIHLNDPVLRYTLTLARISQSIQLLCDNLYLFSKVGLIKFCSPSTLSSTSSKLWLYCDILTLLRVCYEMRKEYRAISERHEMDTREVGLVSTCREVTKRRPELVTSFVGAAADVWLPLNSCGVINVSPGVVGLCGTVSSLISARDLWWKSQKDY